MTNRFTYTLTLAILIWTMIAGTAAMAAAPTITSLAPTSGCNGSLPLVTINGTNLTGATSVTFGGVPATSYTVVTASKITATPAPGTATGVIVVTTPGGTATSATSFTVNPILTTSVTSTPSANNICAGTSVTFSATPTNGGAGPTYKWYKNNVNVVNTPTYTLTTLANNDSVWVIMTSNATCPSQAKDTSASTVMTVNPVAVPSVTIAATATTICAGTPVTFTATPVNGGITPGYQWYKNNIAVGTSSTTYTDATLNNGDSVWFVLSNPTVCSSPASIASAHKIMTVNPVLVTSVTASATATTICAGTSVTFSATPTNGGAGPTYKWYKNNVNVVNTPTYTLTTLANNDSVWVIMTGNATCPSQAKDTSTHTIMTVNPVAVPSVTIAATATTICAGTSVTFTATPLNGGITPGYQWYKNNIAVGTSSTTYTDATLNNGDSVWFVLSNPTVCSSPASIASAHKIMTVNQIVTPSVTVSATSINICRLTSVTFTATPTNGGAAPTYKWYKNGANVVNTATYTSAALANNDSVWVIMTSNATCPSQAKDTSAHTKMTVNTVLVPTVVVAASAATICSGTSVTFTATPTNGGLIPAYQWYKNNTAVGTNASTYADAALNNNDSVWVVMTSNALCASPTTATSTHKKTVVNAYVTPSVTATATATTICAGTSVTFSATPTNGGAAPTYKWYKNGVNVVNTATYTLTTLANNDSVWVVMTSNATCASPATATSAHIIMTVNAKPVPTITASGPLSFCPGGKVILTASAGTSYAWSNGKSTVADTATTSATYTVTATNIAGCTATASKVVAVYSPAVAVSSNSPVCMGTAINLLATPSGGTTYTYSWSGPASFTSTAAAPVRAGAVAADTGIYSVTVTDNHACTVSGSTDVILTPTALGISPFGITICSSSTFNADPSGYSSLVTYTWAMPTIAPAGSITGASAQSNAANAGQTLVNTTTSPATAVYYIIPSSSCSGTGYTVTVTVNGSIGTPSSSTPAAICTGSQATITGAGSTGAQSYSFWTAASGGSTITTSTTPAGTVSGNTMTSLSAMGSGSYTYYVEGDSGSCASIARQAVTVTVDTIPSLPADTITFANPACNMASLTLSTPSSSFYWETSDTGTSTAYPGTSVYTLYSTGMIYLRAYAGVCWSAGADSSGTVTINTGGAVSLPDTSALGITESCGDPAGWTYYAPAGNQNNWAFAINKNGNTFTANVDLTVDTVLYEETTSNDLQMSMITMGSYWNVTLTSGSINGSTNPVSVRFFYNPADTLAMWAEANALALAWGGTTTGLQWFKTTTGITYDPANNGYSNIPNRLNPSSYTTHYGSINGVPYVEYDGLQGFSGGSGGIGISGGGHSLPVRLLSFTATPVDNNFVRLNWATASETDNSGFEVERSVNGIDFEKLGFVQGNGNTTSLSNYQYNDQSAVPNTNYYYRLKQIDVDGNFMYSPIVAAKLIGAHGFVLDKLKPNPASNMVTVNTVADDAQDVTVSLVDMLGRVLLEQPWALGPGLNGTQLDISRMETGTYSVVVSTASVHFSKTLVITR